MFARLKKSGRYEYLQIVENRRDGTKTTQRVICTVGRLDQLHAKGSIETLIQSLSRFSEKVLLILSGKTDVSASAKKIGPVLIFERLWEVELNRFAAACRGAHFSLSHRPLLILHPPH